MGLTYALSRKEYFSRAQKVCLSIALSPRRARAVVTGSGGKLAPRKPGWPQPGRAPDRTTLYSYPEPPWPSTTRACRAVQEAMSESRGQNSAEVDPQVAALQRPRTLRGRRLARLRRSVCLRAVRHGGGGTLSSACEREREREIQNPKSQEFCGPQICPMSKYRVLARCELGKILSGVYPTRQT